MPYVFVISRSRVRVPSPAFHDNFFLNQQAAQQHPSVIFNLFLPEKCENVPANVPAVYCLPVLAKAFSQSSNEVYKSFMR